MGCKEHNKDADWLSQQLGEVDNQACISITPPNIRGQLNKTSNWKAPGTDGVQGYWLYISYRENCQTA